MMHIKLSSIAVAGLVLLAACADSKEDGEEGGGPIAATGSADALLVTTSSPELFAFEAELASLVLLGGGGASSGNLLAEGAQAELTALADVARWTAEDEVGAGTWTSARATFAAGSFAAKDAAGAPLDVEVGALALEAPLPTPLKVATGDYVRVELYLDLVASVTPSATPGAVVFAPEGSFRALAAGEEPALAPFFGVVDDASSVDETLVVEAYRDAALTEPLRAVDVALTPDALLVDANDVVFPGPQELFAVLVNGQTVLEVEGRLLAGGGVTATRIEVLSHAGSVEPAVVITGRVLAVDQPAQELELLIHHVDQGAALAAPVLASLGDPSAIDVAWDGDTAFLDQDGALADGAELSAGQMVQVELEAFASPPFPATRIELLGLSLTGVIDDVAGLPDAFELRLGSGDLVTVHLFPATELRLDTQFQPEIDVAELVVGMKATVKGELHVAPLPSTADGDPVTDGVDAAAVKVHHGYLVQADVAAADEPASTFWTSSGHLAQTFGDLVEEGPLAVVIQPGCLFAQDAEDEAGFFELVASGAELDVKVKGVGSSTPGEVHAYEVKAQAQP
jgi:hypothetical protein